MREGMISFAVPLAAYAEAERSLQPYGTGNTIALCFALKGMPMPLAFSNAACASRRWQSMARIYKSSLAITADTYGARLDPPQQLLTFHFPYKFASNVIRPS